MTLRPGIQALLEDARRGIFEILVAEAVDRMSRDQADVAALYKHLRFAGVTVVTLAEGEISELHVRLKGTINALFLKDLAAKTHRGLRGRILAAFAYVLIDGMDEIPLGTRGQPPDDLLLWLPWSVDRLKGSTPIGVRTH